MTLDEDDVDAIARRVLTLIRDELSAAPVRLVTAKTLAEVLDVKPSWVYAHAAELPAVRLGGDNGQLRFDLDSEQIKHRVYRGSNRYQLPFQLVSAVENARPQVQLLFDL